MARNGALLARGLLSGVAGWIAWQLVEAALHASTLLEARLLLSTFPEAVGVLTFVGVLTRSPVLVAAPIGVATLIPVGTIASSHALWVALIVGGLWDLHRRLHSRGTHEDERNSGSLAGPLFGFFVVLGLQTGLFTAAASSTTGDEPHYLMHALSLWRDGDTNQWNQYQNEAFTPFYWGNLAPKPSDFVTESSVESQALGVVYPLMLALFAGVGGRIGGMLLSALCLAGALAGMAHLARQYGVPRQEVAFATTVIGCSLPLVLFNAQLYPESFAALILVGGLLSLEQRRIDLATTGVALVSGALLLTKLRYAPIVATLGLLLAAQMYRRNRNGLIGLIVVGTLGVAGFLAADALVFDGDFFFYRFGSLYQISRYVPDASAILGGIGLLFDQEAGLLVFAPVLALPLVLLFVPCDLGNLAWRLRVLVGINVVVVAAHPFWHSLPTPPGRYLVPVLPCLIPFLAVGLQQQRVSREAVAFLWTPSLLMVAGVLIVPEWRGNQGLGIAHHLLALELATDIRLTSTLPSLVRFSVQDAVQAVGLILVLACGGLAMSTLGRRVEGRWYPTLLGGTFIVIAVSSYSSLNTVIHPEGASGVLSKSGVLFPANPDLFVHDERHRGWTLLPGDHLEVEIALPSPSGRVIVIARGPGEAAGTGRLFVRAFGHTERTYDLTAGVWTPLHIKTKPDRASAMVYFENRSHTKVPLHLERISGSPPGGHPWGWAETIGSATSPLPMISRFFLREAFISEPDNAAIATSFADAAFRAGAWNDYVMALTSHPAVTVPVNLAADERLGIGIALLKGKAYSEAERVLATGTGSYPPGQQAQLLFVASMASAFRGDAEQTLAFIRRIPREGDFRRLDDRQFITENRFLRETLRFQRQALTSPTHPYQRRLDQMAGAVTPSPTPGDAPPAANH